MPTLILTRTDVRQLLDMDTCIDAVERAFVASACGAALPSGVLGTSVDGGGFHVKTSGLTVGTAYYAAKINANFPSNPLRRGLPTIQGVIGLYDATDGRVLALLDSIEITTLRTAAASAVAAKYLARADASVITVLGCGNQGRSQLRALTRVRPVKHVLAWDGDDAIARRYAAEMTTELSLTVEAVADYRAAVARSDIVVTCTASTKPLLTAADVPDGCFVAAVGADSEEKQEVAPDLLVRATVVADVLAQCARIGDMHHAIAAGVMSVGDVHAELCDVVSRRKPGRTSATEVTVFDSTGTALEDVAAAAIVYERAITAGVGMQIALGD